MNLKEFIEGIRFKFYQPQQHLGWYERAANLFSRFNISLEIANTRLPEQHDYFKKRIGPLCSIPRMSTFAIGSIINRIVSSLPDDSCFVNVGVWNGFSFLSACTGHPNKTCIGIDNFSEFGGPKDAFLSRFNPIKSDQHHFFEMDYIDYFNEKHQQPIGFYIYDGEHSYENQLKGLQIAEPHFSEECIILVDDTNSDQPHQATLDFISQSQYNYEILVDLKTAYLKSPTFWNGILIFKRVKS